MEIKDPHGVWLKSTAAHPMHDSTSNTTFFPGQLIKATHTDWVKGQPVIQEQPDPQAQPAKAVAAPAKPAPKPLTKAI